MNNRYNLYVLCIVAVVAVVGIVLMTAPLFSIIRSSDTFGSTIAARDSISPQITSYHTPLIISGILTMTHYDDLLDDKDSTTYYIVRSDGTRYMISGYVDSSLVGSTVSLTGTLSNSVFSVSSFSGVGARTVQPILGVQNWAVIMFNFQDDRRTFISNENLTKILFNVKNFVNEESYGKTNLYFDIYGWYNLSVNASSVYMCGSGNGDSNSLGYLDYNKLFQQKNLSSINYSAYTGIIFVYPTPNDDGLGGCGYDGVYEDVDITTGNISTWVKTIGMSSRAFRINEGYTQTVIAHELTHSFGIGYHANFLNCYNRSFSTYINSAIDCSELEYQDHFDTMGKGYSIHSDAIIKEQLGWLTSTNIQTVTSPGVYYVNSYEPNVFGIKALKIPRGNALINRSDPGQHGSYLYIEYRQPTGFDSPLYNTNTVKGVLLHLKYLNQSSASLGNSLLVDATPTLPDSRLDTALLTHSYIDDRLTDFRISVLSIDAIKATVVISNINHSNCVVRNPQIIPDRTIISAQSGYYYDFNFNITNNDSDTCPGSILQTSPVIPGLTTPTDGKIIFYPGDLRWSSTSISTYSLSTGRYIYPYTFTRTDYNNQSFNKTINLTIFLNECIDGTIYGQCSLKKQYCSKGVLVDNCVVCGCASGFTCQSTGICTKITTLPIAS